MIDSGEALAGLRCLRRSPFFSLAVILTLGLGMGAATAMFAAVDAWLIEPLPYPQEGRLIALHEKVNSSGRELAASKDDLRDFGAARSLAGTAAVRVQSFGLGTEGAPAVVMVAMFTGDLFHVLGVPPILGRSPEPADEVPGGPRYVWLSNSVWRSRFGADPSAVGKTLRLSEQLYTIQGVLPAGFGLPVEGKLPDFYVPLVGYDGRGVRSLLAVGRLAPGASEDALRSELSAIAAHLTQIAPDTNTNIGVLVRPLRDELLGNRRTPLLLMMGAVLLLLLIACANVANLFLSRAVARARDIATRLSLGATRARLLAEAFIEALTLTLCGAAGGLLVAKGALALMPLVPQFLPTAAGISKMRFASLDGPVLAFAGLLAVATAAGFSLLPIEVIARLDVARLLKEGGTQTSAGGGWVRGALVTAEVALSMMLLLNCGLLYRSFSTLLSRNPGFDRNDVAIFGMGLPEARYSTEASIANFHRRLLEKLSAIPGVQSAGGVWGLPLGGKRPNAGFEREGEKLPPAQRHPAGVAIATPGYFETLRIPLLRGRSFSWDDDERHPAVVVVNEALAKAYFPGQDAVGQRIYFGWNNAFVPAGAPREIVGVVANTPQQSLDEAPLPQLFLAASQYPPEGVTYVLRSTAPPAELAAPAREAVSSLDSSLEEITVQPLSEWLSRSLGDRIAALSLIAAFAAVALVLTALGLFGVISYNVTRQRRELAIRCALGATPRAIVRLVLRRGATPLLVGGGAGWIGALWSSALIRNQLVGVTPFDPRATATVIGVLAFTAVAACLLPALRAASLDPAVSLREE